MGMFQPLQLKVRFNGMRNTSTIMKKYKYSNTTTYNIN